MLVLLLFFLIWNIWIECMHALKNRPVHSLFAAQSHLVNDNMYFANKKWIIIVSCLSLCYCSILSLGFTFLLFVYLLFVSPFVFRIKMFALVRYHRFARDIFRLFEPQTVWINIQKANKLKVLLAKIAIFNLNRME